MKIQIATIPKIGVIDSRAHNRQNVSIQAKFREVCDFQQLNSLFK